MLHWWQPFSGRGVRTHITDDRHWLPLVVAEYLEATGDVSVLDEVTSFIEGAPLAPEPRTPTCSPRPREQAVTVYEHCVRALETGRPTGAHGLPLMGGGDWNDGMNRVGIEGRGESVWLAWFLGYVAHPVRAGLRAARRGRARRGLPRLGRRARGRCRGARLGRRLVPARVLRRRHAARHARRRGVPHRRDRAGVGDDLGLGDPERAEAALDAVEEKLVRRETG